MQLLQDVGLMVARKHGPRIKAVEENLIASNLLPNVHLLTRDFSSRSLNHSFTS